MQWYFRIGECLCSATGDPHYLTYDRQRIHYQGNCRYLLTKANHGACGIEVHVENIPSTRRKGVSTTEELYVYIPNYKNYVVKIRLGQGKLVQVHVINIRRNADGALKTVTYLKY